ncbi:MAG TPA: hypothetical protein VGF76_12000, partial [Polyangiaceae bacterium]
MAPLDLATVRGALDNVLRIRAIDLAMVTEPAQVKNVATVINDALDLPEIVHPRMRPPGIRPPWLTRATRTCRTRPPRGDAGLGVATSGPFLLVVLA